LEKLQLVLGWWNTGLSPKGLKRKDSGDYSENAAGFIIYLISKYEFDFLALGEVSECDVDLLSTQLEGSPYAIISCFEPVGRSRYSQAYIYNTNKVMVVRQEVLNYSIDKRNYRVGDYLILHCADGTKMNVVVSHWPSRLQAENARIREELAFTLRLHIKNQFGELLPSSHIILMGDYNAEPFESSLKEKLHTSRDKGKVSRNPSLFYNPWWKSLGMSECERYCGTHRYEKDLNENWFLFDQMLFSSAFLLGKEWILKADTVIVSDDIAWQLLNQKSSFCDHLPILTRVEKNYVEI
jgi:hypothetical protein